MKNLLLFIIICLGSNSFGQLPSYVPTNGLEAWWGFSTNAIDVSGNNNNGTVNGASLTTDRFSNPNSAYSFDGVDDFIEFGTILNISTHQALSISGWFYLETAPTGTWTGISFGKKEQGTLNLRINTGIDNRFQAQHADAGETNSISTRSDNTFQTGEWYHLVGIYYDDSTALYVNGVQQSWFTGVGNILSNIPPTSLLRMGVSFGSSDVQSFLHGKLDDIGVWNRALDSCEIQALYTGTPCNLSILEYAETQDKSVVKIIDLLGRETDFKPNTPLILIYSDGTMKRVMKLDD